MVHYALFSLIIFTAHFLHASESQNQLQALIHEDQLITPTLLPQRNPLQNELVENLFKNGPKKIIFYNNILKKPNNLNKIPQKLLFVGSPGTGKTSTAQAFAQKTNRPCVFIQAPLLGNEYQNSTVQNLARYIAPLLKQQKPCVIIIDELMSIISQRNSPNNPDKKAAEALWTLLDECAQHHYITLIATTNTTRTMPEPLKNRFSGRIIYFDKPNYSQRFTLMEKSFGAPFQPHSWNITNKIYWARLWWNTKRWSHRQVIAFAHLAHEHALARIETTNEKLEITWKDCCKAFDDMDNGTSIWFYGGFQETRTNIRLMKEYYNKFGIYHLTDFSKWCAKTIVSTAIATKTQNYINADLINAQEQRAQESLNLQRESLQLQKDGLDLQQKGLEAQQSIVEQAKQTMLQAALQTVAQIIVARFIGG